MVKSWKAGFWPGSALPMLSARFVSVSSRSGEVLAVHSPGSLAHRRSQF